MKHRVGRDEDQQLTDFHQSDESSDESGRRSVSTKWFSVMPESVKGVWRRRLMYEDVVIIVDDANVSLTVAPVISLTEPPKEVSKPLSAQILMRDANTHSAGAPGLPMPTQYVFLTRQVSRERSRHERKEDAPE